LLLILKTGNWTLFERLVLWTYAVVTTVELGDYEMEEVYEGAAHPVRVSESKHYSPRIIIVTQCFLTSACVTSARHMKIKDAGLRSVKAILNLGKCLGPSQVTLVHTPSLRTSP
jgi:hypothetical protein